MKMVGPDLRAGRFYGERKFRAINADGPLRDRTQPGRPLMRLPLRSLDIWKTEIVLRRSKIFIAPRLRVTFSG